MAKLLSQLSLCYLAMSLCLRYQFGRRLWFIPLLLMVWPFVCVFLSGEFNFNKIGLQNSIIGLPQYILAIAMGIGIVAREIELGTLEVVYTVTGGTKRVWILKLLSAATVILLVNTLVVIVASYFIEFNTLQTALGAYRGAIFLLVLSMTVGVVVKNELITALLISVFLLFNLVNESVNSKRWSPLFDPSLINMPILDQRFAWLVQNYIGITLLVVLIATIGFSLAEKREKLLFD